MGKRTRRGGSTSDRARARRRERRKKPSIHIAKELHRATPPDVKRKLAWLGERLDQYEGLFAEAMEANDKDACRDILLTMQADGVFSDEFIRHIDEIAQSRGEGTRDMQAKLRNAVRMEPQALQRFRQRQLKRIRNTHTADEHNTRFYLRERRHLLMQMDQEAITNTIAIERRNIKPKQWMESLVFDDDPEARRLYGELVPWSDHVGDLAAVDHGEALDDVELEEYVRLLADEDIVPTGSKEVALPLRHVAIGGEEATVLIRVPEGINALHLAQVAITSGDNAVVLKGVVSRLTGEICAKSNHIIGLGILFDDRSIYDNLRLAIIDAIVSAIDHGDIELVSFENTGTQSDEVDQRIDVNHGEDPEPEIDEAKIQGDQSASEFSAPAPKPVQPVTKIDAAEAPRTKEKKGRIIRKPGRLTWRRAIGALRRIGVKVTYDRGSHPNLVYEGKRTQYINPHDKEPTKNYRALKGVLKDLGIDEDVFWRDFK